MTFDLDRLYFDDDVDEFVSAVADWIRSEPMQRLLELNGLPVPPWHDGSPREVIRRLNEIEPHWTENGTTWDFRYADGRSLERQDILYERLKQDNGRELVVEAADQLGLRRERAPRHERYKAVVVLGGARLAPLNRTRWAAQHLDGGCEAEHVVLLGALRDVSAGERESTDEYAENAETEFDLMRYAGARRLGFDADAPDMTKSWSEPAEQPADTAVEHRNAWARHWVYETGGGVRVDVMAAPSREPQVRRANTADSLVFMADRLDFRPDDTIALVTSAIYWPFQEIAAVQALGLDHRVGGIETLAFPNSWSHPTAGGNIHEPHNYLQECRSVFQAALRLEAALDG